MPQQTVEFYEVPRAELVSAAEPHKYTFRATGKAGRKAKQQRAFDYLKKSGAVREVTKLVPVEVTRRQVSPADFMEALYRQRSDLFRDFNLDGRTLLIGSQDYAEMMASDYFRQVVSFGAEFLRGDRGATHVCGLTVTVIPWMRGLLVMP